MTNIIYLIYNLCYQYYICFIILFYNSSMHIAMNNRKTNVWNVHTKINKYINVL